MSLQESLKGTTGHLELGRHPIALRILRSDLALLNRYEASQTRIDAPVVAVGGSSDETTPLESLLAWRQVTQGAFHLLMIDGGHFTLLDQPKTVMGLLAEPKPLSA